VLPAELIPLFSLGVGLLIGLTWVGGGAVLTPMLLILFGLPLQTAVATDLLAASAAKGVASFAHIRGGQADWGVLKLLWLGALVAVPLAFLAIRGGLFADYEAIIFNTIAVLVGLSGLSLLFARPLQAQSTSLRVGHPEEFKRHQRLLTVLSGGLLGSLVTLTSIGAGSIGAMLLRLIYPLRMTPKKLIANDVLLSTPISLISGLVMLTLGLVDLTLLGILLFGLIPGVVLGLVLFNRASSELVKQLLGTMLVLTALMLIFK